MQIPQEDMEQGSEGPMDYTRGEVWLWNIYAQIYSIKIIATSIHCTQHLLK